MINLILTLLSILWELIKLIVPIALEIAAVVAVVVFIWLVIKKLIALGLVWVANKNIFFISKLCIIIYYFFVGVGQALDEIGSGNATVDKDADEDEERQETYSTCTCSKCGLKFKNHSSYSGHNCVGFHMNWGSDWGD